MKKILKFFKSKNGVLGAPERDRKGHKWLTTEALCQTNLYSEVTLWVQHGSIIISQ